MAVKEPGDESGNEEWDSQTGWEPDPDRRFRPESSDSLFRYGWTYSGDKTALGDTLLVTGTGPLGEDDPNPKDYAYFLVRKHSGGVEPPSHLHASSRKILYASERKANGERFADAFTGTISIRLRRVPEPCDYPHTPRLEIGEERMYTDWDLALYDAQRWYAQTRARQILQQETRNSPQRRGYAAAPDMQERLDHLIRAQVEGKAGGILEREAERRFRTFVGDLPPAETHVDHILMKSRHVPPVIDNTTDPERTYSPDRSLALNAAMILALSTQDYETCTLLREAAAEPDRLGELSLPQALTTHLTGLR